MAGVIVYVVTLIVTSGALVALHAVNAHPAPIVELAVLVIAGVTATVTRYLGLRLFVFPQRSLRVEELRVSTD
jgi:hypothetical protein